MYEFIQNGTGWTLCWGPPPVELTFPALKLYTAPEAQASELEISETERHIHRFPCARESQLGCPA